MGWRAVDSTSRLTVDCVGTVIGHEHTLDFAECPLAIDAGWDVWETAEDIHVFDATNRDMSLV